MAVFTPDSALQGQPVVAVQWGVWSGAGMAASEPGLMHRLARRGYGALSPAAGLAALGSALAGATTGGLKAAVTMAAPFLWPKFLQGAALLADRPDSRLLQLRKYLQTAACCYVSCFGHVPGMFHLI